MVSCLVSNHVMDLIRQYKPEDLPPALTSYVQDRGGYDYRTTAWWKATTRISFRTKWSIAFAWSARPEAHQEKLRKLASAGVTQFNLYLMCGDEEQSLETYQREVLPGFSKGVGAKR